METQQIETEKRLTLSNVLKKIAIAFGKLGESSEYYLPARGLEKDIDDSESEPESGPESDSCSL